MKHTTRVKAGAKGFHGVCDDCGWASTYGDKMHAEWQAEAHWLMNHPEQPLPVPAG